MLSTKEKQKYHYSHPEPELISQLKSEYRFFQPHVKHISMDLVQKEQDKPFGKLS